MANPLRSYFLIVGEQFSRRIKPIIEEYNRNLPNEIRPYIQRNLWMGRHPNYPRRYINRTNKLYIRTGRLTNALAENNPGNISRISTRSNRNIVEYGIDVRQVPYARYHETGTSRFRARPFITPGIRAFREERLRQLQDELFERIIRAWNQ